MDSDPGPSSSGSPKPKRLKTLAFDVGFAGENTLLHNFVLANSDPNPSGSEIYINAVLLSMGSDVPVDSFNGDGHSALHLAVLKNNLLMVKKLLSCLRHVNVDRGSRLCGRSALHLAAEFGHVSIAQELLDRGASVDLKCSRDYSAICVAAKSGGSDLLKYLVEESGGQWVTPFCQAADSGLLESVKFWVYWWMDSRKGWTPLCYAAESGNLAMVECLLSKVADINSETVRNSLCYAAGKVYLDLVRFLTGRGVKVNLERRRSPRDLFDSRLTRFREFACDIFITQGTDLCTKGGSDENPLYCASNAGSLEIVEYLLRKGADINAKDRDNATPLHYAANRGNLEIAAFLIDQGADLRAEDGYKRTALHRAVYVGHLEMVKLLVGNGAGLHAKDIADRTPLHLAVEEGYLEISKWLINRGADWQGACGNAKKSLLHLAVDGKSVEMAMFLMDKGADLEARDEGGGAPLHDAAEASTEMVELLLSRGADVHAADKEGRTALHRAVDSFNLEMEALDEGAVGRADVADKGSIDLIRLLIDKGADVSAKTKDGKTPVDLAKEEGHDWI